MVVVAELESAGVGPLGEFVHPLGQVGDLVGSLPAIGGDEGIDHGGHAEFGRGVEDALRLFGVDHGGVARRCGEAVREQRPLEFGGADVEGVRFDLGEADLCDAGHGSGEVGVDRLAD